MGQLYRSRSSKRQRQRPLESVYWLSFQALRQRPASTAGLIRATKTNPCPHCGKPDWCYNLGDLSVCNRDQPPATGWEVTTKSDKEGKLYYAPIQEKKAIRPLNQLHERNGDLGLKVQMLEEELKGMTRDRAESKNSAPAVTEFPEAADLLNQLKGRRRKSKVDLGDIEVILELLGR